MAVSSDTSPVITEEADRILGRIILRYGAATFALLILMTFGMTFVNLKVPQNPLFVWHKPLDMVSILIVLIPFFLGMNAVFRKRLEIGRALVQQRQWRAAIAALDPFAGPTQRFLDGTGEAHFLLAQAYAGAGEPVKAERARAFVRRHRPGPWADRLQTATTTPRPSLRRAGQEKPKPPANVKRRRRF